MAESSREVSLCSLVTSETLTYHKQSTMNNYGCKNFLQLAIDHVIMQTFLNVIVQTHNHQSSEYSQEPDNPSVSLISQNQTVAIETNLKHSNQISYNWPARTDEWEGEQKRNKLEEISSQYLNSRCKTRQLETLKNCTFTPKNIKYVGKTVENLFFKV